MPFLYLSVTSVVKGGQTDIRQLGRILYTDAHAHIICHRGAKILFGVVFYTVNNQAEMQES